MNDLDLDEFLFDESYLAKEINDLDLSGLTDGKHIRSRILGLVGKAFGIDHKVLAKLGRIVEMVHNATLTHDDVIDNSHTRRGHPSIPNLINNKKSVLLGDYMLAKALHELSDFELPRLTQELTFTLTELVEGEWIQFENTNPYKISANLYQKLAEKKTGSLFRWAFVSPSHFSSKPVTSTHYQMLEELGMKLGLIFQMSDDVIDFSKSNLKTYALDFKNNNLNYVLLILGRNHPELATKFLQMDEITSLNSEERRYLESAIVEARDNLKKHLDRCMEIIDDLKKEPAYVDPAPFQELCTILLLISDRIY